MPLVAIALIAILAVGGGVSAVAQQSLPGQPLYPVKVHVNENLEGAFALNTAARADWDMQLIAERVTEAKQLAAQGTLSASAQTDITNNIDTHVYDVGATITKLNATGYTTEATTMATKFQTMLMTQQKQLASTITTVSSDARQSLVPVVAEIQGAMSAASVLSSTSSVKATARQ